MSALVFHFLRIVSGEYELFCEHYGNTLALSGNIKESLDNWSHAKDFPFRLLVAKTLEAYKVLLLP